MLLITLGVGGTGESYLISAIQNLLQRSYAVTATTGKASYNIHGCTIHDSLLKLLVGVKRNKDLRANVGIYQKSQISFEKSNFGLYHPNNPLI